MPKNKGKGGKNRRRGKNENEAEKRELVFKEDGQEYAQVLKMLGNGRLDAMCFDGVKRLCHIRGKLRKKVWINQGDIILIGLRDYQDAKADVILKYNPDEARNLKTYGELPEYAKINDTVNFGEDEEDDNIIEFKNKETAFLKSRHLCCVKNFILRKLLLYYQNKYNLNTSSIYILLRIFVFCNYYVNSNMYYQHDSLLIFREMEHFKIARSSESNNLKIVPNI
ncbi:UNVERIFIED_CONTAM: Eukaryotic translation initiation factor 1A, X-chromosomal [Trichonephila clavipes]